MKLIPRRNEILGRFVLERAPSKIIRPDETKKTTTLVLIDALGADAEAAGWKVGDVILPYRVTSMYFDGGSVVRPSVDEKEIKYQVVDIDPARLAVQNDGATKFVPLNDPQAAQSLARTTLAPKNGHAEATA